MNQSTIADLIEDLDELALRKISGGVFGVAFVLEHLQDDFVLAGSRVGVFVAVVRASRHSRDDSRPIRQLGFQLRFDSVQFVDTSSIQLLTRRWLQSEQRFE
jgi:predicted Rdx family selenoprotein